MDEQTQRLRSELVHLRSAGREIWENVQCYLQEHEIEELREHLADQLEMFEGDKEVQP